MEIKGPKYINHNGYLLPYAFPCDAFNSVSEFHPKPNTIMICSYPKCGTTWMQNIVYLLQHAGVPFESNLNVDNEIPHLELRGSTYCENYSVVKTHLPLNLLNWNEKAKYILVSRNPKDCCVSFFHHTRGFVRYYEYAHGTFDDYFTRFLNGQVDSGDYFDYFSSWQSRLNDPNVFFCTYEELLANTEEVVKRLASFLNIDIDDNILKKVLEHSSFKSMQKDPSRWSSERPKDMPAFIRKGEAGDWRNHFNEEQSKLIDMKVEKFPLMKELWANYL